MKHNFKLGLFFFWIFMSALLPVSVQAVTLYGVSMNGYYLGNPGPSSLYRIDPIAGEGTLIGDLGYAVNAIAVDPTTGLMYGATTGWSGEFYGLLLIDPATGSATEIGGFGTSFKSIENITFNSAGQLFGWCPGRRSQLVTIDITTGSATLVGSVYLRTVRQVMAFDSSDNLILVMGDDVYNIDQDSGDASQNGLLFFDPGEGGAGFDPVTGLLWAPGNTEYTRDAWIRVTDIDGKSYFDIDTDIEYLYALTFDDFDCDSDGDGILDSDDFCPETPPDVFVDLEGCSCEQIVDEYCPCDSDWKNRGEYVSCIAHLAEDLLADGLITLEEKDAIVSQKAREGCGSKKKK